MPRLVTPRSRNVVLWLVLLVALGVGAVVRWDRLAQEARAARTLTLGGVARELAAEHQPFDLVLEHLGTGGTAIGLVSEPQKRALAQLFQLHDFQALDRQPQLTLAQLGEGVAMLAAKRGPSVDVAATQGQQPLGLPTKAPPLEGEPFLATLSLEFERGDRLDSAKAALAADSARLAAVLEGLSLGGLQVTVGTETVRTPRALMEALAAQGHQVEVRDERMLANFGDLERRGREIATPVWVETQHEDGRGAIPLPVPHAQLVLEVTGPTVNARVTFFPALDLAGAGDGGARFRADVTRDQAWCGHRIAQRYRGDEALKAVALMGELRAAWAAKVNGGRLGLDGYFTLGVCTLAPAVVEQALRGTTTLWPLTHEPSHFAGDTAIDALVRALPVDGRGGPAPTADRLRGSMPFLEKKDSPLPVLTEAMVRLELWK